MESQKSGVEQSGETAQQGSSSSPLAHVERCECPARKQLQRNRQGYLNILEFRKLSGEQWGQREGYGGRYGALTREEIDAIVAENDAALSSPCPCEELRADARKYFDASLSLQARAVNAEAECDQLRAERAATIEACAEIADNCEIDNYGEVSSWIAEKIRALALGRFS